MNAALENRFVDNNIVIPNKQTYEFMHKIIRNEGYKDAVKYKRFLLGKEIKKKSNLKEALTHKASSR